MYLQVKWEGYDEPTWEPRENFINVELFHNYCLANKLTKYIPHIHQKNLKQTQTTVDNTSSITDETNNNLRKERNRLTSIFQFYTYDLNHMQLASYL